MLGRFTVCYGSVLCGRAVYCELEWCTMCYDGVLCVRDDCVLGRCTVC